MKRKANTQWVKCTNPFQTSRDAGKQNASQQRHHLELRPQSWRQRIQPRRPVVNLLLQSPRIDLPQLISIAMNQQRHFNIHISHPTPQHDGPPEAASLSLFPPPELSRSHVSTVCTHSTRNIPLTLKRPLHPLHPPGTQPKERRPPDPHPPRP